MSKGSKRMLARRFTSWVTFSTIIMNDSCLPKRGLTLRQRMLKRTMDLMISVPLLIVLLPILLIAWLAATISTRQNGFFVQRRIGLDGAEFPLLKIRSMRAIPGYNTTVTTGQDPRITRIGRFLRKTKLDEFPQLINVIVGHMSLVGPRPDVAEYSGTLTGEDRIVLSVRPGITGPASLAFRDEEEILAGQGSPDQYNRRVIWPEKVAINRRYIARWSLGQDLVLLFKTAFGSS